MTDKCHQSIMADLERNSRALMDFLKGLTLRVINLCTSVLALCGYGAPLAFAMFSTIKLKMLDLWLDLDRIDVMLIQRRGGGGVGSGGPSPDDDGHGRGGGDDGPGGDGGPDGHGGHGGDERSGSGSGAGGGEADSLTTTDTVVGQLNDQPCREHADSDPGVPGSEPALVNGVKQQTSSCDSNEATDLYKEIRMATETTLEDG